MPKIRWLAHGFIVGNGAFDPGFADVVGGDRQQPIAVEFVVQSLQVIEGGPRRFDDIAAAVVPPSLFQPKTHAGTGNELPEPGGAAHRVGEGLVGAFHYRQQREFRRHAAPSTSVMMWYM